MMHKKNLPVIHPTASVQDSRLGYENAKIVKILRDAPVAVNCKPPHTFELLDKSKHTSPRGARLDREKDFEIEDLNTKINELQ